uniref:J domain-containing protein n=1 Tax=Macrostomum lignano TaxID=282301 RepID=A0A1I8G7E4_9PLAT
MYYEVLGVASDATTQQVKKAYYQRIRHAHPDKVGPGARRQAQEINEAYRVLSDPFLRIVYEQFGPEGAPSRSEELGKLWFVGRARGEVQSANPAVQTGRLESLGTGHPGPGTPYWKALMARKDELCMVNDLLCIRTEKNFKVVLTAETTNLVISELHSGASGAHSGFFKTKKKVTSRFWFPGLGRLVEDVHRGTGYTPHYLVYGEEMRLPVDLMNKPPQVQPSETTVYVAELRRKMQAAGDTVRTNLSTYQRQQKDQYDTGARGSGFNEGDLVYVYQPCLETGEAKKFHVYWTGPVKVFKRESATRYRVGHPTNNRKRKTVHFNNLHLYRRAERSEQDGQRVPVLSNGNSMSTTRRRMMMKTARQVNCRFILSMYYEVLGVASDATTQQVKKAYYQRIRHAHPDKVGPGARRQAQEINEAYRVLSDPFLRIVYEQFGPEGAQAPKMFLSRLRLPAGMAIPTEYFEQVEISSESEDDTEDEQESRLHLIGKPSVGSEDE